jgi:phosphoglycerate kinase
VIVRAGFDVPLEKNIHTEEWQVADVTRIKDALSTIKHLIKQKAKIIIMSHSGRPKGREADKSLWPIALKLGQLLSFNVVKIDNTLPDYHGPYIYFFSGDITKKASAKLSEKIPAGDILFLENLRYYEEESDNDEEFAKSLALYGDVYVNEAFSVAHRKAASTYALAQMLPAYGGLSFVQELAAFGKIIRQPRSPLVLLMGGAKIDDKVETLHNLAPKTDFILIGGAIGNTFFKALGYEIGKSKCSDALVAKELYRNYKEKIILPVDVVVAKNMEDNPRLAKPNQVRPEEMILDIGPETIRKFAQIIKQAKTLIWNGPFGYIENQRFAFGSKSIAHIFAARCQGFAYGIVGGGETVEVFDQAKVSSFIDHISTGGGAMLEILAGKKLPAISVLEGKKT